MRRLHSVATVLAMFVLAACAQEPQGQRVATAAAEANVVMMMPVSTESAEALTHFMQGQRLLDMGRADDARPLFEQATEADPNFAFAYLRRANVANSLEEFQTNLQRAAEHAAGASEAEQFAVQALQKAFDNDVPGQLETAQRMVDALPESPRAWMALANAQSAMGNETEARASMSKAAELSPEFAVAHMALGNSYMFVEPRDLAKAQQHMQKAVELEPNEAATHDLLGDAYRARGDLENAAAEYTQTAELDPTSGNGYQQRGHVNSFMGNYQQARADYDAAIALEEGNARPAFRVYRALVHVHEGNPEAAVEELNQLVDEIDGMDVPDPTGSKIFALNNAAQIALHYKMFDAAKAATQQRDALLMQQAEQAGTEAIRRQVRAAIALGAGMLAAWQGDAESATTRAHEFMEIMEPSTNPLKNRPAHALLGYVSLFQGDYEEAAAQFEQANPNDPYVMYHHALALDGAGKTSEAMQLFQTVAEYNFNSAGLALVRKDAIAHST